ncbi:hypothetical protein U2F26_14790 [Micromonospora sp. 4G57]|uniref:Uncharacterized protein n=1 Tax=Micromonospora sicca TaxID=2202420 RepID=A0ABU5JHK3_9ACTN|nr:MULTISPECIES: hypothetical protein [unclassified Micromonospora]MDZ5443990.1 hypothetical protein [Micromonospora sp. 4G57]MDZ5491883.1 hypothetical protein [Micromonospora sp. 4G53]
MIRREVSALVRLGPLPSEEDDSESDEKFKERTRLLHLIQPPVSDEEAQLLIRLFGVDNCFGLSWTLLHLVESAPSPVVTSPPAPGANQWLGMLWQRYHA